MGWLVPIRAATSLWLGPASTRALMSVRAGSNSDPRASISFRNRGVFTPPLAQLGIRNGHRSHSLNPDKAVRIVARGIFRVFLRNTPQHSLLDDIHRPEDIRTRCNTDRRSQSVRAYSNSRGSNPESPNTESQAALRDYLALWFRVRVFCHRQSLASGVGGENLNVSTRAEQLQSAARFPFFSPFCSVVRGIYCFSVNKVFLEIFASSC